MRALPPILALAVLVAAGTSTATPRVSHRGLFLSPEREAELLAFWPRTADPDFNRLKHKVSAYDEEAVPPAFQFAGGFHSTLFNHSVNADPFGNANREFPWEHPAGLCCSTENGGKTNWDVARFTHLAGIRWWQQTEAADSYTVWDYAPGTAFVEVLLVKDAQGNRFPFAVRLKQKHSSAWNDWRDTVYQPFQNYAELRRAAKARGFDIGDEPPLEPVAVKSKHGTETAFQRAGMQGLLPGMPGAVVRALLTETPFQVATSPWPWTVERGFSVVPELFRGCVLPPRSRSCKACHEHTMLPADRFDLGREWYGRIRGSDGIISFHPLEPSAIAPDGKNRELVFRKPLLESGILKQWRR